MCLLQASLGLLTCVPCYEGLTEAGPGHAPLWLADAVLATRMQFLMAMLAPCLSQLPQVHTHEISGSGSASVNCIVNGPCRHLMLWVVNAMLFSQSHIGHLAALLRVRMRSPTAIPASVCSL